MLEIERRRLGRSELTIPRVALGCGNFGGVGSAPELFGQGLSQDQAFELMDAAWEQGIDHFDTADAYGGGRSERMIGAWMRSRGVRPTLTTKTYNPMDTGADHGLAPERVERQLESSLERLGVERVDLYLTHEFDSEVPLGETFAAIERAVDAGKVAAYGVSNFDAEQLAAALDDGYAGSGPERALAAGACRRGRGAPAVRARAGVLPRVQPARRGLADRQVPPRRAVPGGVADDAAPRAIRGARRRPHVRPARCARRVRPRARDLDGGRRAGVAARRRPRRPDRRRPGPPRPSRRRCARRSSARSGAPNAPSSTAYSGELSSDPRPRRRDRGAAARRVRERDGRGAGRAGPRRGADAAAVGRQVRGRARASWA